MSWTARIVVLNLLFMLTPNSELERLSKSRDGLWVAVLVGVLLSSGESKKESQ